MKAKLAVVGEDKFTREFPVEGELELGRAATGWDMVVRHQGNENAVGIQDSSISGSSGSYSHGDCTSVSRENEREPELS